MSSNQPPYLLDSSVLVKLLYREEDDAERAVFLLDGFLQGAWEIRLADLSLSEVANALHYLRKFTAEEIVERVQSIVILETEIYSFSITSLRIALELSEEKNVSIYDAYLVALAKQEGLRFVTADTKLLDKMRGADYVLALTDFPNSHEESDQDQ